VISEYVDSASLRSVMQGAALGRTPLPPPVAVAIVCDVLRALRSARELWREAGGANPHGGLVPDSVWIATFGETLLADFGIAAAAARIPSLLRHTRALAYRAPEQLEGKTPDETSDVYAAGVLLWEMLANRALVAGDARGIARLDSVERAGAPVPPMLVAIVGEAVARDPSKRFPCVDALLEALRALGKKSAAPPEQVAAAVQRLVRRELETRRAAIELVAGFDRASKPPESARPTARPPAPETVERVVVTGKALEARFPSQEAPTARRQTPRPNTLPSAGAPAPPAPPPRPKPPPPALRRIAAGASLPAPPLAQAPAQAEPRAAEAVEPSVDTGFDDAASGVRNRASAHDSQEPGGGLAMTPPALTAAAPVAPTQKRSRRVIVIGVSILATLVLLGWVLLGTGTKPSEPAAETPTARPTVSAAVPAAPETAAAEPPPAPAIDDPPTPASASARTAATPAPAPVTAPAPVRGQKPYRPRGI
jgi:serine/threonine-protein kinase